MFDIEALKQFYDELSASDGITVLDFYARQASLFQQDRASNDLNDYRLGKNPWKKLRDEITPVSRFLKYNHIKAQRIRFPLDNNTPDCLLLNVDGEDRGVEVTIERGREQYHLAKEINAEGMGRGFIGVQDDASQAQFDTRMSNPRSMYSTRQALDATEAGILRCLSRKNDEKYSKVFYLLIQANLSALPKKRWSAIKEKLSQEACSLPFEEVYVIGNADSEPWGFRLK